MEKYFDLHGVPLLKKYVLHLIIQNRINFYGIKGFFLVNHLSHGQFSRRK